MQGCRSGGAAATAAIVVVHIQHLGQDRLGTTLLLLQLLHLLGHHDGLLGDLDPGARHPQQPRHPLQEQQRNLGKFGAKYDNKGALVVMITHPLGHLVGVLLAVVVVEHQDGRHHARRHHEHDAVEVGACQQRLFIIGNHCESL